MISELGFHVGIHFKRGFNLGFNAWLSDAPLQGKFLARRLLVCLYLFLEIIRRIRGFLSSKTQSIFRDITPIDLLCLFRVISDVHHKAKLLEKAHVSYFAKTVAKIYLMANVR